MPLHRRRRKARRGVKAGLVHASSTRNKKTKRSWVLGLNMHPLLVRWNTIGVTIHNASARYTSAGIRRAFNNEKFERRVASGTRVFPSYRAARRHNTMPELQGTITLTPQEQELFTELLESSNQAGLATTTLRCAGGWVRDKLMGRESLDIDIALDNMMGKEFAERVNSYLESRGKETHNVAVIMSNPDQSKHLETARMKIRGLWIDLVNLRSEEYAHNSRIPTMTFGTPEQDAFRRDFTINSLFYNINTKEVEDYTGKGIEDMKLGVIRTPLAAKETFVDDPLRVLRAIRFASRFGFALDESLVEAASDDKVRCYAFVLCAG
jgi:hypothetical protein